MYWNLCCISFHIKISFISLIHNSFIIVFPNITSIHLTETQLSIFSSHKCCCSTYLLSNFNPFTSLNIPFRIFMLSKPFFNFLSHYFIILIIIILTLFFIIHNSLSFIYICSQSQYHFYTSPRLHLFYMNCLLNSSFHHHAAHFILLPIFLPTPHHMPLEPHP